MKGCLISFNKILLANPKGPTLNLMTTMEIDREFYFYFILSYFGKMEKDKEIIIF